MIGRVLVGCLLLIAATEARVDFEHSSILDEFDFQGQASVTIDDLCASTCRIYASIAPESKKLAGNILIQQQKGFVSVADVAARVDPATGQKLYLEMSNTRTLTIANTNAQNAAGPLVLYIVRDAETYNHEIYEAEGLNRSHIALPATMTVMSAKPFTLTQPKYALSGAKQTASVTMTGYDATNTGGVCKTFYHETFTSPFPGFTFEVNGPIITIAWDNHGGKVAQSEMVATLGITNTQQVAASGWVGSPGYHGCLDKQPPATPRAAELIGGKNARSVRECGGCRKADPERRVWATACCHAVCRGCADGKGACPLCEKPTTFIRLYEEKSCGICACDAPYNWGAFTGCGHTMCGACCIQLYLDKGIDHVCTAPSVGLNPLRSGSKMFTS